MDKPDSIIGFISGPSVNILFMHSLFEAFKRVPRLAWDWVLVFGPYIHKNRNQLQEEFMLTDRDWLLMVDNDMVFTPDDVKVLFAIAEEHGPGVYSAPYILESGFMVCGVWDDEVPMVYHQLVQLPEGPRPIGVVGMGFTLIHREVFEAVGPNAYWPIQQEAGEDISFSWRAREAGYTPWLVPECNPGHFKQVTIYPHEQVRNQIGEEVNLVQLDEELKQRNIELMKGGVS